MIQITFISILHVMWHRDFQEILCNFLSFNDKRWHSSINSYHIWFTGSILDNYIYHLRTHSEPNWDTNTILCLGTLVSCQGFFLVKKRGKNLFENVGKMFFIELDEMLLGPFYLVKKKMETEAGQQQWSQRVESIRRRR